MIQEQQQEPTTTEPNDHSSTHNEPISHEGAERLTHFFANKGAQVSLTSSVFALIITAIAMLIFQTLTPFWIIIAFFLFSIFRAYRKNTRPVLIIEKEQKALTMGRTRFAFDEIRSWNMSENELFFRYLTPHAKNGNSEQIFSIKLHFFEEAVKQELALALEDVLGLPNQVRTEQP